MVVGVGAASGLWSGWWVVVRGNGERGAIREETKRVNIVDKAFWVYMWSINLKWCTSDQITWCVVHHTLSGAPQPLPFFRGISIMNVMTN